MDTRDFCRNKLGVSDAQLRYMPWPDLLHRLVLLQRSLKLSLRADLSEHAIVMRICRRDDFLVGALWPRACSAQHAPMTLLLCALTTHWRRRACVCDAVAECSGNASAALSTVC